MKPTHFWHWKKALRVDLGLDRLELREAVRAPDVLLQGDALLFAFCVRKIFRTKRGVVGLERPKRVRLYVVVLRASEDFAFWGLRVERGELGEPIWAGLPVEVPETVWKSNVSSSNKHYHFRTGQNWCCAPDIR